MKTAKLIFYVMIISSLFSGCSKKPSACFTIQQLGSEKPNSHVNLINCSTDADHYLWNIDSFISSETNLEYAFDNGTHTIQLTAYSEDGKNTSVTSQTIEVLPLMGRVSFRVDSESSVKVEVIINGQTKTDYVAYGTMDDCDADYNLFFDLPGGTYNEYSYQATEKETGTHTWSGTIWLVPEDGCVWEVLYTK